MYISSKSSHQNNLPLTHWDQEEHISPYEYSPFKLRYSNNCAIQKLNNAKSVMIKQLKESPSRMAKNSDFVNLKIGQELWQAANDLVLAGITDDPWRRQDQFMKLCREWVAYTTDAAWHSANRNERVRLIRSVFAPDWSSLSFGYQPGGINPAYGMEDLVNLIESKLKQIPDLKIHILDVTCAPAIDDGKLVGIFTSMPDMSLGTPVKNFTYNEVVIEVTGETVAYPGIAVTLATPNGLGGLWYQSEMVLHDDASLLAAFGPYGWMKAVPKNNKIVKEFGSVVDDCQVLNWFGSVPNSVSESKNNPTTDHHITKEVDSLPNLPNQQACGEGYIVCTEAIQGYGVNCALGSCTKRIQPNSPEAEIDATFDVASPSMLKSAVAIIVLSGSVVLLLVFIANTLGKSRKLRLNEYSEFRHDYGAV